MQGLFAPQDSKKKEGTSSMSLELGKEGKSITDPASSIEIEVDVDSTSTNSIRPPKQNEHLDAEIQFQGTTSILDDSTHQTR